MTDAELTGKVHSSMYHQCQKRGYAAPVDVLLEIGVLPKQKYEDWRHGRVDYLERVCTVNLRKLSFIMHQIRVYAQKSNLKPSVTVYKQWAVKKKNGQGHTPVIRLRFSKSGDAEIEKWYATHFVDAKRIAELKAATNTAETDAKQEKNEQERGGLLPRSYYWKEDAPMATTRIMPLHTGKGRSVGTAISDILDYVKNPQKTDGGRLITSVGCDSRIADAEFLFSKGQYLSITGRTQENAVIAYHFRQSFRTGEVTPEEANRVGVEFAQRFLKGNNAFIVCTHIDKSHVHNHIIWNSTTLDCTRKFRNFWGSTKAVRNLSDTICVEHGLSIIANPKRHGKSYNKWLGDQAKPSHRELLRTAIDTALKNQPKDLDALLKLLQADGIEVARRGKNISLRAPGWKSAARFSSLGDGYSEDDLIAVITGKKGHTPSKKPAVAPTQKTNLLIDIQAKLDAGKGAGYERWAKVYNLKQMAQTMNYLREHGLLDIDTLQAKTDAASERFHALSSQIKAAEARMDEITLLKPQIINYAKTRKVFDGYKASKYSKKYLAEHETDILLHRAAKKTFNDMGIQKLPTVGSLQEEYAKLLAEKKAAYTDYRRARDEMRELLTHRANVDKILGTEEREVEKRKEHEQR